MKLIYVADPMCSWCYGFGKEMTSIVESLPGVDLEIVVGGMGAGSTQIVDDAAKRVRLQYWARVEELSGAPFNREAWIARKDFVYDTEPICRAVVTARLIAPEADLLKVFRALQRAFYIDGKDTTDGRVLAQAGADALAAQGIECDAERFFDTWATAEAIKATEADFMLSRQLGVTGFPTLFVEQNGRVGRLSAGYAQADKITATLRSLSVA